MTYELRCCKQWVSIMPSFVDCSFAFLFRPHEVGVLLSLHLSQRRGLSQNQNKSDRQRPISLSSPTWTGAYGQSYFRDVRTITFNEHKAGRRPHNSAPCASSVRPHESTSQGRAAECRQRARRRVSVRVLHQSVGGLDPLS